MDYIVKILSIKPVTHDVKSFGLEKPAGYTFVPGQATDVSINRDPLKAEMRPFTFTSLNREPHLELTIKRYPEHNGITDKLHQLKPSDELIIRDVWGAIEYKGPGYFIAGGAGITPFLSILRWLQKENKLAGNTLLFSNKKAEDVIYEQELTAMLGSEAKFILTREEKHGFLKGPINEAFLKKHIKDTAKHFYVCGPDPMIKAIADILSTMGASADAVVFEK
jgi:ferredoxin-NADP reductase